MYFFSPFVYFRNPELTSSAPIQYSTNSAPPYFYTATTESSRTTSTLAYRPWPLWSWHASRRFLESFRYPQLVELMSHSHHSWISSISIFNVHHKTEVWKPTALFQEWDKLPALRMLTTSIYRRYPETLFLVIRVSQTSSLLEVYYMETQKISSLQETIHLCILKLGILLMFMSTAEYHKLPAQLKYTTRRHRRFPSFRKLFTSLMCLDLIIINCKTNIGSYSAPL